MFGALGFSMLLITYTLAVVTGVATTPAGAKAKTSVESPREYYFSTNRLDTEKAAEACYKMDMTLATERTDEEFEAIGKELLKKKTNTAYHTSGHRKSTKQPWVWSDKENDRITKFHWNKGEPNNAKKNEFCIVTFIKNGKQVWNDVPCEAKNRFICQSKHKIGACASAKADGGVGATVDGGVAA